MTIYIICCDSKKPTGGIKQIYRHVDILNAAGVPAYVVQSDNQPRYDWFPNQTPLVPLSKLRLNKEKDLLVIPEIFGPDLTRTLGAFTQGVRKVIFNQNCYYTFNHYGLNAISKQTPYLDPETVAVMVVSEHSRDYMHYLFPNLPVYRIVNAVDTQIFRFQREKKHQVAFMPRKNSADIEQLINMLKFRGCWNGVKLMAIDQCPYLRVADVLQETSIFLSLSMREGFGLPPIEAMACGALVVGYHGFGGVEYFKPEFSFPIDAEDLLSYAKQVEVMLEQLEADPRCFDRQREAAAAFVAEHYSLEKEVESVVSSWNAIVNGEGLKS